MQFKKKWSILIFFPLKLNVFLAAWLMRRHQWLRKWFGQVTRHYLNQWWPSSVLHIWSTREILINTLMPRQNVRHCADDTFKRIFLNQNVRNWINISLKFVPKGLIHNITSLVQIMAWQRPGDKPLSEPMMVRLLTHICVARPQWVKLGYGECRMLYSIYCFESYHEACHLSNKIWPVVLCIITVS